MDISVAFWTFQVIVVDWPSEIVVGSAAKATIVGAPGGGPAVTVTKALRFVLPPGPVAIKVYDVLSAGETLTDPEVDIVPEMPEIETAVAPEVVHARVAF
jgi:hypothetical protein